jgi:hypothetical protein
MKNLFSKTSIFLLWATSLAVMTSCQSQTSLGPTPPIEMTPTQASPVETPSPTPSPISEHKVGTSNADDPYGQFPYQAVENFGEVKSGKLSGIVFYPARNTLFAVRDNGRIVEIKTDGTLIRKKKVREKADFEGITYSPATEMLYVAIEGEETILEVNPGSLEAERDIPVDRMFEGAILLSPEGNGIEGITFVPATDGATNGSFYLVNQSNELGGTDPSIVFEVEMIIGHFSVGVTDLSGIQYIPSSRRLLIISDADNLLLEVSLAGQVLETHPLPGKNQEGVTMDDDGYLYIAQDTEDALLKFTSLDNANDINR